jgi:hypothetical protein
LRARQRRLEIESYERDRANKECITLTKFLDSECKNLKWMEDEEQLPPISLVEHIRRIDLYCAAVLCASPLQSSDEHYKSIHPADFGEDEYAVDERR